MKRLALIALLLVAGISAQAQLGNFYQVLGTNVTRDTVVNTATVTLTTHSITAAPAVTTTVRVAVTKISGVVAGTITLMGSFDNVTYKAITTPNTVTALATHTATDASGVYDWIITGSPFPYYRVSWTGSGTMSASFTAALFRSK